MLPGLTVVVETELLLVDTGSFDSALCETFAVLVNEPADETLLARTFTSNVALLADDIAVARVQLADPPEPLQVQSAGPVIEVMLPWPVTVSLSVTVVPLEAGPLFVTEMMCETVLPPTTGCGVTLCVATARSAFGTGAEAVIVRLLFGISSVNTLLMFEGE